MPALLLWGAEDKIFPPAYAEAWEAGLPDARTVVIPECGHLPQVEATDRSVQEIKSFIGGIGS